MYSWKWYPVFHVLERKVNSLPYWNYSPALSHGDMTSGMTAFRWKIITFAEDRFTAWIGVEDRYKERLAMLKLGLWKNIQLIHKEKEKKETVNLKFLYSENSFVVIFFFFKHFLNHSNSV